MSNKLRAVKRTFRRETFMQIDLSQQLKNLDGSDIANGTLRQIAVGALHAVLQGDELLPPAKKYERGKLAKKIYEANGEAFDISAEELADLKTLIARAYGPLVVVQAFDMIEGK